MNTNYAGFWKRFCAYFIDTIITQIVAMIVAFIFGFVIGMSGGSEVEGTIVGGIIGIVLPWIYYAAMESSSKQATLGKMALGIKVTSTEGEKISFGKASGRYFGKILSTFTLFIGYFMVAFTEKKQGLHDIVSGCLVLNKNKIQ